MQAKIHNIDGFSAHADQGWAFAVAEGLYEAARPDLSGARGRRNDGRVGPHRATGDWNCTGGSRLGDSYELRGYHATLVQTMQETTDQKRALLRMLKNVEFDYLNLKNYVHQQIDQMDDAAIEKLAKQLRDLQAKIRKVG